MEFGSVIASIVSSATVMGICVYFLKQFIEETKTSIRQLTQRVSDISVDIEKSKTAMVTGLAQLKSDLSDRFRLDLKEHTQSVAKELDSVEALLNNIGSEVRKLNHLETRVTQTSDVLKTHAESLKVLLSHLKGNK